MGVKLWTTYYSAPGRGVEYCDERICLCVCVCLSVRDHIFGTTQLIFTEFLCMLPVAGKCAGLRRRRAWVQIAATTLSGNCLRQTVHTHRAFVHQAAKLVAALLRIARVTASLADSNGSLPSGLWLMSPSGWLPRTGISCRTLCSAVEYGLPLPFYLWPYLCPPLVAYW